jgi:hypothetical protein
MVFYILLRIFRSTHVTKPYEFIGFGATHVTKPYEFIGFGAMHVTKPYGFIRFGAMHVTKQTPKQANTATPPTHLVGATRRLHARRQLA